MVKAFRSLHKQTSALNQTPKRKSISIESNTKRKTQANRGDALVVSSFALSARESENTRRNVSIVRHKRTRLHRRQFKQRRYDELTDRQFGSSL